MAEPLVRERRLTVSTLREPRPTTGYLQAPRSRTEGPLPQERASGTTSRPSSVSTRRPGNVSTRTFTPRRRPSSASHRPRSRRNGTTRVSLASSESDSSCSRTDSPIATRN